MVTLPLLTEVPAVKGPPQGEWTLADWEELPDDGNRYEIINGMLYMSTSLSAFHQWVLQIMYDEVGFPAKQQRLGIPFFAPIGVIMPGCDPVQPDFVFVLKEHAHIIRDRRIFGVPDLIIEILSPGNRPYDEEVKLVAYAAAGVPEYGLIDPGKRTFRLHTLEAPERYAAPREFGEGDTVTFACLPTIPLKVSRLFAGAPDTTL